MAGELVVVEDKAIDAAEKETTRIDLHVHVHLSGAWGAGGFEAPYARAACSPPVEPAWSGARKLLSIFFLSMAVTGGGFLLFKGGSGSSIKELWGADNSKVLAEAAATLDANTKAGDFSNQLWQTKPGVGTATPPSANPPATVSTAHTGQAPAKTGPGLFGLN